MKYAIQLVCQYKLDDRLYEDLWKNDLYRRMKEKTYMFVPFSPADDIICFETEDLNEV